MPGNWEVGKRKEGEREKREGGGRRVGWGQSRFAGNENWRLRAGIEREK